MSETFTLYKLIVLYMLSKVDFPLTTAQISEFILDKGYTTFFKLQQALSELKDAELIREEHYGMSVAKVGGTITANKLDDIAGKTKFVSPDDQLVQTARNLGISFGD